MTKWFCFAAALCCLLSSARADEVLHSERFGDLHLLKPARNIASVVIFFSDDTGWNGRSVEIAEEFRRMDALVIGVDSAAYLKEINADKDEEECSYLAGEIERLSQSGEKSAGTAKYRKPYLAGFGAGASLALAITAQYPRSFPGVLTLSFNPRIPTQQPLCVESDLKTAKRSDGRFEMLPPSGLEEPWVTIQGQNDANWPIGSAATFAKAMANARVSQAAGVGADLGARNVWQPLLSGAFESLQQIQGQSSSAEESIVSDLPLIENPAPDSPRSFFVIFYSGDGGWAYIDKEVSRSLVEHGVNVVGVDCLRYFWMKQDPDTASEDLARIASYYAEKWNKPNFVVLGFSMGADVASLVINRLPHEIAEKAKAAALLSPGEKGDLEVHIGDWLGVDDTSAGYAMLPEVQKLSAHLPVLAVCGTDDDESLCPKLDPKKVTIKTLPGDHHFDGDYESVTQFILDLVKGI